MADFFKQPAATFDDPIELLMACHGRVRHFADLTLKLAQYLPEHGADKEAQQAASNILRYFDVAAPLHHEDEDDDLFPLLAAAGDDKLRALIAATTAEHTTLGALWQAVRARLALIAAGTETQLPLDLAAEFAQRYPEHADREDREIYPRAFDLLLPETLAELGRKMAVRRGVSH